MFSLPLFLANKKVARWMTFMWNGAGTLGSNFSLIFSRKKKRWVLIIHRLYLLVRTKIKFFFSTTWNPKKNMLYVFCGEKNSLGLQESPGPHNTIYGWIVQTGKWLQILPFPPTPRGGWQGFDALPEVVFFIDGFLNRYLLPLISSKNMLG